jgi:hypothetical protein
VAPNEQSTDWLRNERHDSTKGHIVLLHREIGALVARRGYQWRVGRRPEFKDHLAGMQGSMYVVITLQGSSFLSTLSSYYLPTKRSIFPHWAPNYRVIKSRSSSRRVLVPRNSSASAILAENLVKDLDHS